MSGGEEEGALIGFEFPSGETTLYCEPSADCPEGEYVGEGEPWREPVWVNAFDGIEELATDPRTRLPAPSIGQGWLPPRQMYGDDPLLKALVDLDRGDTTLEAVVSEVEAALRDNGEESLLRRWLADHMEGENQHALHMAFGHLDLTLIQLLFQKSPLAFMQLMGMGSGEGGWMSCRTVLELALFSPGSRANSWNGAGGKFDPSHPDEFGPLLDDPSATEGARSLSSVLAWMCDAGVMTEALFSAVGPTQLTGAFYPNGETSGSWAERLPQEGLLEALRFCQRQGAYSDHFPHARYADLSEAIAVVEAWSNLPPTEKARRTVALIKAAIDGSTST